MFPELRPGQAPGPVRITLGIVLMVIVAIWAFAAPGALAAPRTAEAVITESLQDLDAAADAAEKRSEVPRFRANVAGRHSGEQAAKLLDVVGSGSRMTASG
jgi:hypothetical protein